ncbi:tetratricopeptide repeat protein [Actinoplanes sp. NPDC026670]|uniref:tetratricopeptide repeat protein n=1 Tax=Actinoplanes sp. NPDC026670 TaxID=3154700 RepID=UPI0033DDC04C
MDRRSTAVARYAEVHRLAVAGREADIAREVGNRLCTAWLRTARFADVEATATATLTLGPDTVAFYQRGGARFATGRPGPALEDYQLALIRFRWAGNRRGEAATLSSIGRVHNGLGDLHEAMACYERALPILREVGDPAGEATALNNMGTAFAKLGDQERALAVYELALAISREIGDRVGEAATLNNIGSGYKALQDLERALAFHEQALRIVLDTGHRPGEAVSRFNIAMIHRKRGDLDEAIHELEQVVELDRQIGHPDLDADNAVLEKVREEKVVRACTGAVPDAGYVPGHDPTNER